MSKKNKKEEKKSFTKVLKENAKDIKIIVGNGEEKTVNELTSETVDGIVASPMDGMIPATAAEAVDNAVPGATCLTISTKYARTVYCMYENALKYGDVKQSMMLTIPAEDIDSIFDGTLQNAFGLLDKSNVGLVIPKFPEKLQKRACAWAEEDDSSKNPAMFVIKIPNLILFYGRLTKNEPATVKYFDLIINVVRTSKSLKKLRKKRPDEFKELMNFVVTNSVNVLKEMGVSCVHIPLVNTFFEDPHEYATAWCDALGAEAATNKILTRMEFCAADSDTLVSFTNQVIRELINHVGITLV